MSKRARLAVKMDSAFLKEDEAQKLWKEFSAYMDEHEGDTKGFATLRGWISVSPEYQRGQAVLVIRSKKTQ